jgi:hypothetical protein
MVYLKKLMINKLLHDQDMNQVLNIVKSMATKFFHLHNKGMKEKKMSWKEIRIWGVF